MITSRDWDFKSGQRDFKSGKRLQIGIRGISNWSKRLQIGTRGISNRGRNYKSLQNILKRIFRNMGERLQFL